MSRAITHFVALLISKLSNPSRSIELTRRCREVPLGTVANLLATECKMSSSVSRPSSVARQRLYDGLSQTVVARINLKRTILAYCRDI